ncbi:solute carrier family 35, member F5, partial [Tremellales sp. Uapishka_1]
MPRTVVSTRRYLVGVALLLSVVMLWTASNFITNGLETGENSWNKPFLITYLNTASFALYLVPTIWRRGIFKRTEAASYEPLPQAEPTSRRSRSRSPLSIRQSAPIDPEVETAISEPDLPKLSIRETAEVAAWWSAVWFIANWAVNASLAWTSVASVTILSSTSGFFTLGLGRLYGVESLTRTKVAAVIASFLGVLLVTQSDSSLSTAIQDMDLPTHPILGDFAALLSAAFYAVYVVLLKVRVGDEDRADMQLMLGFAGLFNIICLIPVFPLLHYTGWETFELPPTKSAWFICGINSCITLSSDYLYVLAMLKTTPMLVTIGLSLTIPLALLGSFILPDINTESITLLSIAGATLVSVGFGMLGWQGWEESQEASAVVVREPLE